MEGNYPRVANYLGDNYLGTNCPGAILQKTIVWGAVILGDNCPGCNYPGGNCPGSNCPRTVQKLSNKFEDFFTVKLIEVLKSVIEVNNLRVQSNFSNIFKTGLKIFFSETFKSFHCCYKYYYFSINISISVFLLSF